MVLETGHYSSTGRLSVTGDFRDQKLSSSFLSSFHPALLTNVFVFRRWLPSSFPLQPQPSKPTKIISLPVVSEEDAQDTIDAAYQTLRTAQQVFKNKRSGGARRNMANQGARTAPAPPPAQPTLPVPSTSNASQHALSTILPATRTRGGRAARPTVPAAVVPSSASAPADTPASAAVTTIFLITRDISCQYSGNRCSQK